MHIISFGRFLQSEMAAGFDGESDEVGFTSKQDSSYLMRLLEGIFCAYYWIRDWLVAWVESQVYFLVYRLFSVPDAWNSSLDSYRCEEDKPYS